MKNIVVGIDFSNNSINSLKHAVAISLKTGGALHLIWVKTPGASNGLGNGSIDNFSKIANEKLDALVKECKAESPASPVQSVILEGKPFREIPKYASNLEEAIIVIGTHGVSGFEERFIGSNAYKTICSSTVPVLILREGIQIKRDLTQILVPIDTSFETLQKIKPAISFAQAFAAKVLLVGAYPEKSSEDKHVVTVQTGHAARLCLNANVRHEVEFLEYKGSISPAIVEYAKEKDVNLMVVMREGEADISDFWVGNAVQQLLPITPMPLLIIPNINYFSITK